MEEKFKDVLEKNEKVIKVYKPNKLKYWTAFVLTALVAWVWVFMALIGAIPDEGSSFDPGLFCLLLTIAVAVFAGGMLISILFGAIYYHNRFYAYTGKRIIIRSGVVGIDYKSLEFQHLTATSVQVTFLDKILHTGTGNLAFGSPSSPIGGMNQAGNPYSFKHILKPYDALREIKEVIDTKEKK